MRANLKEARQKAGMTQQQMADRLSLTVGYYQKTNKRTLRYFSKTKPIHGKTPGIRAFCRLPPCPGVF
jgi:hypothetical protein